MKVLLTGSQGQLGRELALLLSGKVSQLIASSRASMDFSDPAAVEQQVAAAGADWVINCAAYTRVDLAEQECELASRVNTDSVAALARGAARAGSRVIHISTDFVFAGNQGLPYREEDTCAPVNHYGYSKWQGEQALLAVLPDATIVRTAWVFGLHGNNFVKTILRLAAEREQLTVVDDQIGSPSWTRDIATTILQLVGEPQPGIFHFTNEGVASWYDFAHAILATARELGFPLKAHEVLPLGSADYPQAAKRPHCSVLGKSRIRQLLPAPIPHWQDSLRAMMLELQQASQ